MTEQQTESPERLARPLIRLASLVGVATSYTGMSHDFHEISDEVLISVLEALGIDATSESKIDIAITRLQNARRGRLVAPTVLHTVGEQEQVHLHVGMMEVPTATITLENGGTYEGELPISADAAAGVHDVSGKFVGHVNLTLPADLPVGYHTLTITTDQRTQSATLISAPKHIPLIPSMRNNSLWGWMAQIYSIRSQQSWGVGDFDDLRELLIDAKRDSDADFVLVNPLHAAEPVPPLTPSPYLPVSRRFVNFTYISPTAIPEYYALTDEQKARLAELHDSVAALNNNAEHIDRDTMWRAKMEALWMIYKDTQRTAERQAAFDAFKQDCGQELEAYATWCLCYDKWGAPEDDPGNWERKYTKDSPEIAYVRDRFPETLEFYRWLEWIAIEQLQAAQQAARQAGMKIGLMADMAVGVHPQGADVWWNPERFAKGATVGAPPDMFNQQGQNWSQPPLNPLTLDETGYKVYRDMVHVMFLQAGAVRIDHILGLFRLWWIPEHKPATDGTYVYYNHNAMLSILAIEASRANGIVVGEDLGVVPPYVAQALTDRGILGCAVEWFEQMDGVFTAPQYWREYALASVDVHDMPPAAGYLEYEHVKVREELGLLAEGADAFRESAEAEQQAMVQMLCDNGYLKPEDLEATDRVDRIVMALYRALQGSPCKLKAAAIVDGTGERRTQNQPGTNNEYPNWRIPLADAEGHVVPLEGLFKTEGMVKLAKIMNQQL
ncbi:4-alpha-glucanotransferase [Bifidobacterium dolichotidis]|uniref:4-alpha-glucanotransferase n=1 Tax=Bifidobacterium dolichotidis TaxID=2306976 RepID=A0A430FQ96_9BIFI|nr:4-alpha-glucanotransferase [Bifidobacterium dolichotidis]RSX54988.1 4-alpha-glucanotransferase [Bifidobacterium dolichotidis]